MRITQFVIIVLILALVASGCTMPTQDLQATTATYSWMAGESPVPAVRTGLKRQCVTTVNKACETTDSGIYYLSSPDGFLIYADNDGEVFVPVCSRPDCGHADAEGRFYFTCSANIQGQDICYYDGKLYQFDYDSLYCMKMDGTDRELLLNIASLSSAYKRVSQTCIWNGVLSFCLEYVDSSGVTVTEPFHYKLDGSMKEPARGGVWLPYGNHGEAFIGMTVIDGKTAYEIWDPESNTTTFLTYKLGSGYYGTEEAWVIVDGVITEINYTSGEQIPLLDTGFDGECYLHCFPDCMAVYYVDGNKLHLYNWNMEPVGEVALDFEKAILPNALICGETAQRIYLAASWVGMPEYYIEKSELGTDTVQLHKVVLPELAMFDGADEVSYNP